MYKIKLVLVCIRLHFERLELFGTYPEKSRLTWNCLGHTKMELDSSGSVNN